MVFQISKLITLALLALLLTACGVQFTHTENQASNPNIVTQNTGAQRLAIRSLNANEKRALAEEILRLETRLDATQLAYQIVAAEYEEAQALAREFAIPAEKMRDYRVKFNESSTQLAAIEASIERAQAQLEPVLLAAR